MAKQKTFGAVGTLVTLSALIYAAYVNSMFIALFFLTGVVVGLNAKEE